jgi:hypothetical protein
LSGAEPPRWEYQTAADLSTDALNRFGEEGWELVAVENRVFYFKRPRIGFKEQVTLDQKRRYYAQWNVPVSDEGAGR